MKISFALVSVLAGLAMANPVPEAAAPKAAAPGGGEVGTMALDGNCVSCVRRNCGDDGINCLKKIIPLRIGQCLALKCADDIFKCCVIDGFS
ncbi:hypothetical protein V8F06_012722 [Rhypophila decipiens]